MDHRDLRAEAFLKGVGFWLMSLSMLLVLLWIAIPLFLHFRDTGRAFRWAFLLFFCASVLWLGRSLYRLGDAARSLMAALCLLGCGITFLVFTMTLSIRPKEVSPVLVLVGGNAILWAAVGVQLARASSARVCSAGYQARHGASRPIARFYSSPWFWLLVSVHGAFVVALTHSLWQVLLD